MPTTTDSVAYRTQNTGPFGVNGSRHQERVLATHTRTWSQSLSVITRIGPSGAACVDHHDQRSVHEWTVRTI